MWFRDPLRRRLDHWFTGEVEEVVGDGVRPDLQHDVGRVSKHPAAEWAAPKLSKFFVPDNRRFANWSEHSARHVGL